MNEKKEIGLKASAYAALALAFASFGDAFLYPFLPVNFAEAGVPVIWVGLLLSINRFVRIFSNTMIVHAFAKYGLRVIMIIAVALAIISTLGYGVAASVVMWLMFRVMWGLAFSAMRIGTLAYALQNERRGFALGVSRSLQESGPMLSLFLAPLLLQYLHIEVVFYALAFLSLPALYFAINLPAGYDKTPSLQHRRFLKWPSSLNSITLISAIVIDGIVVVVLVVLFLNFREHITPAAATALAAFYLGYRRVCSVALSPAGGWIADKIGMDRIFNISVVCIVLGLIVLTFGWIGSGAVIVFTFYSINSAITPGSASMTNSHSLAAVAENATWRDIGAAVGTLIGGLLISSPYLDKVLLIGIAAMIILLFIHLGTMKPIFKRVLLWK
jgi:DHA1 family multidrug resistance protein-like MFS transporter